MKKFKVEDEKRGATEIESTSFYNAMIDYITLVNTAVSITQSTNDFMLLFEKINNQTANTIKITFA